MIIVESGATKSDVLVETNGQVQSFSIDGYNPNRDDSAFFQQFMSLNIPKNLAVYFYGSGISNPRHQDQIKKQLIGYQTELFSDILGAARACLKHQKGLVSILGTGAITAYYDGENISKTQGGHGYLINDYGSGLDLARQIVTHWLDGQLSPESTLAIESHYQIKTTDFISEFYQTKNMHFLASVCQIAPQLAQTDQHLNSLIHSYFDEFIEKQVKPFAKNYHLNHLNIVGSIAYYFQSWIVNSLNKNDLQLNICLQKPAKELLKFHLQKK